MLKIKNKFMRLSKIKKINCLVFLVLFILVVSISIPSLARHKNRNTLVTTTTWNGNVASSYRAGSGTENDPYVISNASELAYLSTKLLETDYANQYFVLNNDIIINNGIFNYDSTNGIQYILDGNTYYVKEYTNEYYDNLNKEGTIVGNVNLFNPLNNFKGHLNGNSYRIYGLYISNIEEQLGLFTNLSGNIENLYVENSIVYGGNITGGVASTSTASELTNILYNGYVVSKNSEVQKVINNPLNNINLSLSNIEEQNLLELNTNEIVGEIISTSLTGTLTITNPNSAYAYVKINDTEISNDFELDLGTNLLTSLNINTYAEDSDVSITLSNLSYNITYKYSMAGGIVGFSKNTTLKNIVNKGNIYGNTNSGGIVGVADSITLNNSYNKGDITSTNISGGLIGKIERSTANSSISNSYNAGSISSSVISGIIGSITNSAKTEITNTFDTSPNLFINIIENADITFNNCYYTSEYPTNINTYNRLFTKATLEELKNKEYGITNIQLNEFIDNQDLITNPNNVWIYNEELPILFIDDLNNLIANIYVNTYSWNNLSYELNEYKVPSLAFTITETDSLNPLKEIYYYISNSKTPLLKSEIDNITWNTYNNIVQVIEEGYYVIYAKVVDYRDNVTYLNTDVLAFDITGPDISINLSDNTWNTSKDILNSLYITDTQVVNVSAQDTVSGLSNLEYYISNTILDVNDITEWTTYIEDLSINQVGTHIIYAKGTDNFGNVSYVNSDYIIYNGYALSNFNYGRNIEANNNISITNKSSVSFNATYTDSNACLNCNHNLISNTLLPINTIITLIDNNTLKVYEYKVLEGDFGYVEGGSATYPLTLFKEIGKNDNTNFTENNSINDNYKIILDFKDTNIETDYSNIYLYLELKSNTDLRSTIASTIKSFNIYSSINNGSVNAEPYLTIGSRSIDINSDSSTDISISSGLTYKYVNDSIIYDTTNEDKNIGIAIKLVDINGNLVTKDKYKNLIFKMNNKEYYPDNDNVTRINLESGVSDITKTLTIETSSDNMFIEEGTYYFEISNYVAYDGLYPDEYKNIKYIPVTISNTNYNTRYNFNVTMSEEDRIIKKSEIPTNIIFDILESGALYSPSIRISLYKKNELTANNQDYTLIDLNTYTEQELDRYSDNIYNVPISNFVYSWRVDNYETFEINLLTNNLEKTGYKYVFDLYNGTQKISTVEKKFIIR